MPGKQTNNDLLDFQNFYKVVHSLEEIYDYKATDAKVLEYHRVLVKWGVTNENFPVVVDEVLKKSHKFPSLAAFWSAKIEADPWK